MCAPLINSAPTIEFMDPHAQSVDEIQAWFSVFSSESGILQPFLLQCQDEKGYTIDPVRADNTSGTIIVKNLQPNTVYNCLFTASTYPAPGQNPDECTSSVQWRPIRTQNWRT